MTVRGTFQFKGLSAYLEQLAETEQGIDDAVTEVLEDARPVLMETMINELKKTSEQYTGATEDTLFVSDVEQEGNYISVEAGADTSKDPAGFHKEYGTARQAAEPWNRPTFRKMRGKLKAMMQAALDKTGVSK